MLASLHCLPHWKVSTNGMFHILGNKFKCCETTSAISLLTLTCVELGEENQFHVFSWSNCTTYLLSFHPNTVCPQWLSRLLSSFCTVYSDLKISVAQHMTLNAEPVLRHTGCAVWTGGNKVCRICHWADILVLNVRQTLWIQRLDRNTDEITQEHLYCAQICHITLHYTLQD